MVGVALGLGATAAAAPPSAPGRPPGPPHGGPPGPPHGGPPGPPNGGPPGPPRGAPDLGAARAPAPVLVAVPAGRVAIPPTAGTVGRSGLPDAAPRAVSLPAFWIDRTEVSVAAFAAFAREAWSRPEWWSAEGWAWAEAHPGGAGAALRAAGRGPAHPVVAVSWYEAEAFCRSRGGRLPREDEWEVAACGVDGRRFPWGDEEARPAVWYDDGKGGHVEAVETVAADQADARTAGPHGLVHSAGNVWEWTADAYHVDGPAEAGPYRTLRGGSYMNLPSYATCAHREPARPARIALTTGFRCAYDAP